jgi:hypothetical protein
MTAEDAAYYVGESSVESFLRSVGKIWPEGITIAGKRGKRWTKESLDRAIEALSGEPAKVRDAADVL